MNLTRVRIPNRFTPRWYQSRYMAAIDSGKRFAFWVVHRRGGKDLTDLHQECKDMHDQRGIYWHVFPTMEQGRKALWDGFTKSGDRIMEQVFPKAIRKYPKEWSPSGEMLVELRCGSLWRLIGSDRMEVVGAGPRHVSFSEYALAKPTGWDLIRPMIRENNGTARFLTTPRGRNHAHKLFTLAQQDPKLWYAPNPLTIFDTKAFGDPHAVLDEERRAGMPEPLVRQEYLCDWTAALVGSVWGDLVEFAEREGRLEGFDHEMDGVYAVFDLGISDSTAIWFFRITDGFDFIDYYESHGKPLSHYWDVMEAKGYKYRQVVLPHDAKARSLQTGVSILDQTLQRWPNITIVGPSLSLADGIQAGRWLLQQPKTRFHPRCSDGLECLRQYHYEYDEEKKNYSSKPEHDWASHGADAFRYSALVANVMNLLKPKPASQGFVDDGRKAAEAFTLDKMWELNEREQPLSRRI